VKLYVERDRLPPPEEEEFYLADLAGLAARDAAGEALGQVREVEDHGGGAILVLDTAQGEVLLPFTKAVVPVVDVAGGFVIICPPAEVLVREEADAE
jgi:16S rRNA processing protein RimM